MTPVTIAQLFLIIVVVLTLGALLLAIYTHPSLVSLLLLGTIGVAQLFPGVIFGLFWKRATTAGVVAGLFAGISTGVSLVLNGHDPYKGLDAGFIALMLNLGVTSVVSVLTRVPVTEQEGVVPRLAMAADTAD